MPRGRQASSQDSDVFPDIPKIDRQESETTDDAMVQTYVRTEGPSDGGSAPIYHAVYTRRCVCGGGGDRACKGVACVC